MKKFKLLLMLSFFIFSICSCNNNDDKDVDSEIIESSIRKCALEAGEGCLSVDEDHEGYVHRNYKIKMKAYNALTDKDIVITAMGYDAIVLQHEYDHLNGMLYYDRIDKNKPFAQLNNEELL